MIGDVLLLTLYDCFPSVHKAGGGREIRADNGPFLCTFLCTYTGFSEKRAELVQTVYVLSVIFGD